jgi:hypothetical protein
MTLPDLGSERPTEPSETRQMVEHRRATEAGIEVGNRPFLIALAIIAVAIVVALLLLR